MGKIRWYKRDPDAALSGMMELSLEERGAYNTVLDLIYSRGGDVPDDPRFIAGWLRVDVRVWKRIRDRLVELGKLYANSGSLRNSRADKEVVEALGRVENASSAGKVSAQKRAKAAFHKKDVQILRPLSTPLSSPEPSLTCGDSETDKSMAECSENNNLNSTDVGTAVQQPFQLTTTTSTEESNTPLSDPPLDIEPDTVSTSPNGSVRKRKSAEVRGTRLPEQWHPGDDGLRFAAGIGLTPNEASAEADRFRDYWRAVPGQKGRKADWPGTWRNWCRRAADNKRANRPREPASIMQSYRNVSGRASADPWDLEEDEPSERRALSPLPFGVTFGRA